MILKPFAAIFLFYGDSAGFAMRPSSVPCAFTDDKARVRPDLSLVRLTKHFDQLHIRMTASLVNARSVFEIIRLGH